MNAIKAAGVIIFLLAANCSAAFASERNITAKLKFADNKVTSGDKLSVKFTIINKTKNTIWFFADFDSPNWSEFKFTSKILKRVPWLYTSYNGGVGARILKAGETYSTDVDLSRYLEIVGAGTAAVKYKLNVNYIIPSVSEHEGRLLAAKGVFKVNVR